jgi:high frequency lysogenization protein
LTYSLRDSTLALAGIFQACHQVQNIARTGNENNLAFTASINSLLLIDAASVEDVFGGTPNLRDGLKTLLDTLSGGHGKAVTRSPESLEVTKYVIGIMALERKLKRHAEMLLAVRKGIERAQEQAKHFSNTHENVLASLAGLYTDTISTLQPRIMVNGEQTYFSDPGKVNRIRALLLAAIRAAVLWRQCGGSRWQLLLQRKKILAETKQLLDGMSFSAVG